MKKIVLGAILVLLITVGGGVYFLLSNLDGLVKTAIETYGSQAAKTSVKVQSVKIGLRDGSGAIRGLTVGNPPGFISPQVFSLGEISAQIDLKSISENLVVIDHITVKAPEVFFELNQAGQINLDRLKQNISSGSSATSSSSPNTASSDSAQKILIRKLLFTNGKIHAKVVPLNKNYELNLPEIELKNLGGGDGATPAQITDKVLQVLTDRALAEIEKQGIDQYKKQLEDEVNKRINAEEQKIGQKIKDKLGQEAGEQVEDQFKSLFHY